MAKKLNESYTLSKAFKFNFMKSLFVIVFLFCAYTVCSQSLSKMPDSVRQAVDEYTGVKRAEALANPATLAEDDRAIKDKLVKLAYKNAEVGEADARIEIAEISRKKAGSTLLSSLNLGANANEFVINNSPQANFFPKYNLGLSIPLDIFAKAKAEKKTTNQLINISNLQKEQLINNLKARVLIAYETYKEKKQQVELQQISMQEDVANYERAQQDFVKQDGMTLEDLNKLYKITIEERSFLAAKVRDYNIAIIQLEELIGMPLEKALPRAAR